MRIFTHCMKISRFPWINLIDEMMFLLTQEMNYYQILNGAVVVNLSLVCSSFLGPGVLSN